MEALKGVDLQVERGSVFGLLGPNGAGKTTMVRILTTLLLPSKGRATVEGLDVVRDAEELRFRIGLAGQSAAVDENLTGLENLEMVGRLYHLPKDEAHRRASDVLERFDLADAADRPAKTYSGGMRRRLDLAASLVGRPEVLFLDEPTTGLDPRSRLDVWDFIRELQQEGTTLMLTTQYLEEADHLCDRIAVIDHGTLIAEGTSDELKDRIGGEVLELHVEHQADLEKVTASLSGIGTGEPNIDVDAGTRADPRREQGARDPARQRATPRRDGHPARRDRPAPSDARRRLPLAHRTRLGGRRGTGRRADRTIEASREEGSMSATITRPAERRAPKGIVARSSLAITDGIIVARRNLLTLTRVPTVFIFELVQPIMFVLLFRFIYANQLANLPPGLTYVQFLMPGIFIQNAIFGSTTTAVGLAEDMKTGIVDRFRSLPMGRSSVLLGRAASDLSKNFLLVLIVIGIGHLVGFRFENGMWDALGVVVLALAVGFTFSWAMACIGLSLKKVEAVQAASFTLIFPVVFVSSAFVPVDGMASFLQPIARHNPVTIWCNLARYLSNGPVGILDLKTKLPVDTFEGLVVKSVAWIVVLLAIFVPLADPALPQARLSDIDSAGSGTHTP